MLKSETLKARHFNEQELIVAGLNSSFNIIRGSGKNSHQYQQTDESLFNLIVSKVSNIKFILILIYN
jgi:hypothetical protein